MRVRRMQDGWKAWGGAAMALLLAASGGGILGALEPSEEIASPEQIRTFLDSYCVECHGAAKEKGGLRLDDLAFDFVTSTTAGKWIEVMDNLNLAEMPPEDAKQPAPEDSERVARWVAAKIREVEAEANSTSGRVVMRRLNRTEYTNTVRDLLGVEFLAGDGPMAELPDDATIGGFDKLSKGLLLDPSLMGAYFDVARMVAEQAIVTHPPEFETKRYSADPGSANFGYPGAFYYEVTDEGVYTYTDAVRTEGRNGNYPGTDQRFPVKGKYRIRFHLAGLPGERGEPIRIQIEEKFAGPLFYGEVGGSVENPEVIEVELTLDPELNNNVPAIRFLNPESLTTGSPRGRALQLARRKVEKDPVASARLAARGMAENDVHRTAWSKDRLKRETLPCLLVADVEIEGPIYPNWPSKTMSTFFPDGPVDGSNPEAALAQAREVLATLLPRAYRRPVTPNEIDWIVRVIENEMHQGVPYLEAFQIGLVTLLCSPDFLLLAETPRNPSQEGKYEVDDFELASRLSYFLWSSLPDAPLFELAARGELSDPAVLEGQVERMLDDPRAQALVDGFAAQWFKTDEFDQFAPDPRIYKEYYAPEFEGVGEDFKQEALAFFKELIDTQGSVLEVIDSDWTMVNDRLARFYGIPGVEGDAFRRVALPADSRRGGLLGMGGMHQWGTDGVRTKPVERGKYILDVLFNDAPPPPPPNAGEVEPNIKGENLSVRDRLEQHKQIESCASCHRGIDPYGLAMENFNVIGQWRDVQDGEDPRWKNPPPIDVSGTLPNGRSFQDYEEFKQALLEQEDRFLRGVTEKLFLYALGRTLEASDRGTLDRIIEQTRQENYSMRSLIRLVATSPAFRQK